MMPFTCLYENSMSIDGEKSAVTSYNENDYSSPYIYNFIVLRVLNTILRNIFLLLSNIKDSSTYSFQNLMTTTWNKYRWINE